MVAFLCLQPREGIHVLTCVPPALFLTREYLLGGRGTRARG